MAYKAAEYHPAFEEYSETIFELAEDGVDVIQARIAERLGVSRPAVSEMIKRMAGEGLVEIHDQTHILLTDAGASIARTVVRRHRLAERFLTDVLDLSWTEAHHEAGRWEHVISPAVEAALVRVLNDPTTCPHGNPIPGSGYEVPCDSSRLAEVELGAEFTVRRIPEELEFEPGQLEFLESSGLMPGNSGTVTSISPDGTTVVSMSGTQIGVGPFSAERIVVTTNADTPG